ncbi:MAG: SDR family oxidoreductase, partial [Bacteroidota bacterium]
DEDYQKVMDINVGGVFYGMKYQVPALLASGGGSIINISSIAGLRGFPNSSVYSASKHAVIGLTKSVAVEYARKNIRVNAVCPVFTRTPLFEQIFQVDPSYEEKLLRNIPMGRYGTTADIASAILYLCSEDASFVNGQSFALDGGFTAV